MKVTKLRSATTGYYDRGAERRTSGTYRVEDDAGNVLGFITNSSRGRYSDLPQWVLESRTLDRGPGAGMALGTFRTLRDAKAHAAKRLNSEEQRVAFEQTHLAAIHAVGSATSSPESAA
ncbi:MAG: hypothetical protein ACU85V_00160 [Gammaproteobacteria bacterium]